MSILKYTVVIIKQEPEAFLLKCGYCSGSGRVSGYACDVCDGMGKVWLKIPPDWNCDVGILRCAYCAGRGRVSGYACDICSGVGALIKCFPRIECSYCDGRGRVSGYACDVCGGCGSVWIENLKAY